MCIFCDTQKTQLCELCKKKMFVYYDEHFCHVCHRACDKGFVHKECMRSTKLDGVIVVVKYNKSVKIIIEELKYNLYFSIADEVAVIMKKRLDDYNINFDVAIPIPLHKFKKNYRGFNQAELLAKKISTVVDDCILRTKKTKSQVGLSRKERINNLKDVFKLKKAINYKYVLLIDDVMTTGTTLEECAAVLKNDGVKKVYGLVFARGD